MGPRGSEVRVKAWRGDLAALLQLQRRGGGAGGGRGGGANLRRGSITLLRGSAGATGRRCSWGGATPRSPGPELTGPERWRFRVRLGWNTRLPTAGTETHPPFRLKLYIFHFKFCNIASSLILLSFALLVFFFISLVLNIYLYYLFLAFFFLFSYFTKWETEWWTADNR